MEELNDIVFKSRESNSGKQSLRKEVLDMIPEEETQENPAETSKLLATFGRG